MKFPVFLLLILFGWSQGWTARAKESPVKANPVFVRSTLSLYDPPTCQLSNKNGLVRQTVCYGETVKITATTSDENAAVQWHRQNTTGGWTAVSGATQSNLTTGPGIYKAVWSFPDSSTCTTENDTVSSWKAFSIQWEVAACKATILSADALPLPGQYDGEQEVSYPVNPMGEILYSWQVIPEPNQSQFISSSNSIISWTDSYFSGTHLGSHKVVLTVSQTGNECISVDTLQVDSLNQKNLYESAFTFENSHCQALLTDTLPSNFRSILYSPGSAVDSTEFSPGQIAHFQPTYIATGVYSLTYRYIETELGCIHDYPLTAHWSDIQVKVPSVYVNHGLTSYGLAVGSLGAPWTSKPAKYEYQWFKNGTPFQDGNQMSAPDTLGPYHVLATDSLGCQARDTLTYVFRDMYSTNNIWVRNQTYNSVRICWDSLTSLNHMVVIREGQPVTFLPEQGKGYSVSNTYGVADLGDGQYGIFNGSGGRVDLGGIVPNKEYFGTAFAWKIANGDTLWDTTHVPVRIKTKEIPTPKAIDIPAITPNQAKLKWTRKDGLGVLLAGKRNGISARSPKDSINYAWNLSFTTPSDTLADGSKVLYLGTEDSVMVTQMDSLQNYHFKIWYFKELGGQFYFGEKGLSISVMTSNQNPDSLIFSPDSGFAFSQMTINGKNLLGVDKVMIGNRVSKIRYSTDNTITCQIPEGSNSHEVKVRKGGVWYTALSEFIYRQPTLAENAGREMNCTATEPVQAEIDLNSTLNPPLTNFGGAFTPRGQITVLVMYFRNNSLGPPSPLDVESIWPDPNEIPEITDDNFYTDFADFDESNTDFSLSNFYYQMSKNSADAPLEMRFKVLPFVINTLSTTSIQDQVNNFFAADAASANPQYLDFLDDLDTRKNNPGYMAPNDNTLPDGQIDFVLQLFRSDQNNLGGSANLSYAPTLTVNGQTLSMTTGINGGGFFNIPWRTTKGLITHEISHLVYASPHVFFNNSIVGNHFNTTAGWGTMNLNGGSGLGHTFLANAWESWIMGWKNPVEINSPSHSGTYFVSDFTRTFLPGSEQTSGEDALKIKIPGTYQNLWISYHSGVNPMDKGQLSGNPKPGLYLMVENMGIKLRSGYGVGVFAGAAKLKSLHQSGNVEIMPRSFPSGPYFPFSPWTWKLTPELNYRIDNSYSFNNKSTWFRLKTPFQLNSETISFSTHNNNATGTPPNELVFQPYYLGQDEHPNTQFDMAFGQGTEPQELGLNFNTSLFGHVQYFYNSQEIQPIVINGLYVKIFPMDPELNESQARKVEVKFDQNRLTVSNKRMAGYFHLIDLPDLAKDLIIGSGNTLGLDKLTNPNRTHKDAAPGPSGLEISYPNLYPDFITPSRFICKAGSVLELEEDATFIIENESGLVIENGATVILGENARIVVKPGCTFMVQNGATITAATGATIEVGDNSYYCLESLAGLSATQVLLGHRLGAVSPKLAPYLSAPANCGTPLQNFKLAFACDGGVQRIDILNYTETVDVKLGNTTVLSDVSSIPLAGLADGHYTVLPRNALAGAHGSYASTFDVYGQTAAVSWTSGDRSLANILVLNHNLSISGGTTTLEPGTQVYIKGTPVYGETMFSNSITGGDISLSGTAKMEVRTGSRFQGMCGNMWGGLSISGDGFLAAYDNMQFEDSYDGIQANSGANGGGGDAQRMNFHIFNARFANNLNGIKSAEAIDAFNFIRNSTFTSSIAGMKAPFEKPSQGSCLRQISRYHVVFDQSWVKTGNFWNNTLEFALNGLSVVNNNRGFNSVGNRYRNHYGPAISLGEGFSSLLDRENIVVPKDDIFCAPANTLPNPYISLESPYAKFGIRAESNGGFTTITGCQISGEVGFDEASKAVGIYANQNPMVITQSRLENLNHGFIFAGGNENGEGLAHLSRNKFTNNLTSIELASGTIDFQLRCNEFITPNPTPTGQTRYGLRIGADAVLVGNRIGGSQSTTPVGEPNSNRWPLSSLEWNPLATPDPILPQPVTGFVSIENQSENEITYWAYHNEFLGNVYNPNGGSILRNVLPGEFPTYTYSLVDWCQLSNNCTWGTLEYCTTYVPKYGGCGPLPMGVNWVRACEGSTSDQVDWPIFIPRPGLPDFAELQTQALKEIKSGIQLGQSRPNPGRDKILIPYYLPDDAGQGEIWINEVSTGREVGRFMLKSTGQGELQVDVSGLSSGVYAYRLLPQVGKSPSTMKFIVIR